MKANLRREVTQMKDQLVFTEFEAEGFAKNVKVDAVEKARALLADLRASFERTACEFEERVRDERQKEVAQTAAEIASEAVSVPQQKDDLLNKEASSFTDLRNHRGRTQI